MMKYEEYEELNQWTYRMIRLADELMSVPKKRLARAQIARIESHGIGGSKPGDTHYEIFVKEDDMPGRGGGGTWGSSIEECIIKALDFTPGIEFRAIIYPPIDGSLSQIDFDKEF